MNEQNSPALVGQVERPVRPAVAEAHGSDEHLTALGAPWHWNLLHGVDRADMLGFGRACMEAERQRIPDPRDAEIENLRAALQWYADGLHFDKASPGAWDTVSGEPQNWWCDEAGTATVEDGSIAAMVLRGELTGTQVQALD